MQYLGQTARLTVISDSCLVPLSQNLRPSWMQFLVCPLFLEHRHPGLVHRLNMSSTSQWVI